METEKISKENPIEYIIESWLLDDDWKERLFKRIEEMEKEFIILGFSVSSKGIEWEVIKKWK